RLDGASPFLTGGMDVTSILGTTSTDYDGFPIDPYSPTMGAFQSLDLAGAANGCYYPSSQYIGWTPRAGQTVAISDNGGAYQQVDLTAGNTQLLSAGTHTVRAHRGSGAAGPGDQYFAFQVGGTPPSTALPDLEPRKSSYLAGRNDYVLNGHIANEN